MNAPKNIGPESVRTFGVEPVSHEPAAPSPEPYIDKIEVARRLGRTVRCVDNWMKRGLIPFFKIGRTVAFKWNDVETHLSKTHRVCRRAGARSQFTNR
jgi:hypothetical protein